MRKTILILLALLSVSVGYTKHRNDNIDLDVYLRDLYLNKEYTKVIELSRIIQVNELMEYRLPKYGIKWNYKNTYVSDSSYYWEYNAYKIVDKPAFFYRYVINTDEFKKYFCKEDLEGFDSWVKSEFNTKIPVDEYGYYDNANYREILKRFKLAEIYNFLQVEDTVLLREVFENEAIKKEFREKIKALNIHSLANKTDEILDILIPIVNKFRFVHPDQIQHVLLKGFNKAEIMQITYAYVSFFIKYDKMSGHTEYSRIDNILKYNNTICNGYANLMRHFLTLNGIETYKITLTVDYSQNGVSLHATNVVVFNNNVYYLDATWKVYYFSVKGVDRVGHVIGKISDFSYITDIDNVEMYKTIDRFNSILKVK